ncbi:MAG: hypothetical protein J0M12_09835 [Deltaproteobacteria bacterium]|nr:hypothetical protein [Deltaproteobacteria bacterium]
MMRLSKWIGIFLVVLATASWFAFQKPEALKAASKVWLVSVKPGELSKYHANLENNCTECHAPNRGVIREQCVTCHAAQTEILKKQNTSFHSSITSCTGCHFEHQGKEASITRMDHTHLALTATEMLKNGTPKSGNVELGVADFFQAARKAYHGIDAAIEKSLNCSSCHANQDRHRSLFGSDCSSCHETIKWSLSSFRHPLPTSRDCSQCHQAPPSHYMMHFEMISKKVASTGADQNSGCCGSVKVTQCYACHQTTSWNDIKGIGWYKHH